MRPIEATAPAGHSKLGASSSHRWMHCAASVQLIDNVVGDKGGKSTVYSVGGHNAHEIAATCLGKNEDAWALVGNKIEEDGITSIATPEDAKAVQHFLDAVRKLPQWREGSHFIEVAFHCPEIHRAFYGQSDLVMVTTDLLDVWDYKHGAGIAVDVKRNSQLMMYAVGVITHLRSIGQRLPQRVRLTICQPRAFHPDGPIRHWETTADALMEWVKNEWLPAAARTEANDPQYATGGWCQFCPARLDCPLLAEKRARLIRIVPEEVKTMEDYELASLNADLRVIGFLKKPAADETYSRLMNGRQISGSKLVQKKSDRVWKDGSEKELSAKYGDEAYERKLKSPAKVEEMPGGTALARKLAYKPDNGFTVADVDDVRSGEKARTAKEVFGV